MFLRILFLFGSISSEIVWIDKLHYFHEEIYFPNNGCHGNKKGNFSVIIITVASRKKNFFKNLNWVDWITVG